MMGVRWALAADPALRPPWRGAKASGCSGPPRSVPGSGLNGGNLSSRAPMPCGRIALFGLFPTHLGNGAGRVADRLVNTPPPRALLSFVIGTFHKVTIWAYRVPHD